MSITGKTEKNTPKKRFFFRVNLYITLAKALFREGVLSPEVTV